MDFHLNLNLRSKRNVQAKTTTKMHTCIYSTKLKHTHTSIYAGKKNEKYPHGNDYVNWKINILLLISIHSKFLTIFQKVSHIIILIIKMFFLLEIYLSQY